MAEEQFSSLKKTFSTLSFGHEMAFRRINNTSGLKREALFASVVYELGEIGRFANVLQRIGRKSGLSRWYEAVFTLAV
jgi:hypothetical protein